MRPVQTALGDTKSDCVYPVAMQIAVIIPAAGAGRRFSPSADRAELGRKSKVEHDLAGRPVFLRAVELFLKRPEVVQTILAVDPDDIEEFKFRWGDKLVFHSVMIVSGGRRERWETVLEALEAVDEKCTHVAVHDAARPLTSEALIERVFEAAGRFDAVVPAVAVSATLKRVADDEAASKQSADPLDAILGEAGTADAGIRRVVETIDRNDLVEVQTPQVFEAGLLHRAYAQIRDGVLDPDGTTDDAALVEKLGEAVRVVEGESTNLKITRPEDMKLAEALAVLGERDKAASLGAKRLFGADEDER